MVAGVAPAPRQSRRVTQSCSIWADPTVHAPASPCPFSLGATGVSLSREIASYVAILGASDPKYVQSAGLQLV